MNGTSQLSSSDTPRRRPDPGPPDRGAQAAFVETSTGCLVRSDWLDAFRRLDLTTIEAVFAFQAGVSLAKRDLAPYRERLRFQACRNPGNAATTLFLKRYDHPPVLLQLSNWVWHRRKRSCARLELEPMLALARQGIAVPSPVACGDLWGRFFEKRSFLITEEIPNAQSLEKRTPDCFLQAPTPDNLRRRRNLTEQLAMFVRRFHQTGYRHRDLYFSHIFYNAQTGSFHLIDLARAFKPDFLRQRYTIKDIAQLHYSAPAAYFSRMDRLRFWLAYAGHSRLSYQDKRDIREIVKKAMAMARHNRRHGRPIPFLDKSVPIGQQ